MARFSIVEVIMYYDGLQLALVYDIEKSKSLDDEKYIACQSLDDGVYLATKISGIQLEDFKNDRIDVRSLMTNPYKGDIYILIHPEMGSDYIQLNSLCEFYGFKVDVFNPAFLDWVIPDGDLYYSDH